MGRSINFLPFSGIVRFKDQFELQVNDQCGTDWEGLELLRFLCLDDGSPVQHGLIIILKNGALDDGTDLRVNLLRLHVPLVHPLNKNALEVGELLVLVKPAIFSRLIQEDSVLPSPILLDEGLDRTLQLRRIDSVFCAVWMLRLALPHLDRRLIPPDPDEVGVQHLALIAIFRHEQLLIKLFSRLVLPYLLLAHPFDRLLLHFLLESLLFLRLLPELHFSDLLKLLLEATLYRRLQTLDLRPLLSRPFEYLLRECL